MTANQVSPSNDDTAPSALDLARNQRLSLMDLLSISEALNAAGQQAAAAELYKTWVAFNDNNPTIHLAYFNYAVMLNQLGDRAGAVQAFRACLKANPEFAPGHINLGRALEDAGLIGHAVEQWSHYAEATKSVDAETIGHRHMTLQNMGRVLEGAGKLEEAETALLQAFELRPELPEAGQHWASLRQRQCKWPILAPSSHIPVRKMLDAMSSLTLSCYADDPMFQLAKAYRLSKMLVGARPDLSRFPRRSPKQKSGTGQRLRVGYPSPSASFYPLFATKEAGLFEKYGFDPEMIYVQGVQLVQVHVAGQLDVSTISSVVYLQASVEGADLIQIYTALVYEGPFLAARLARAL